MRNPAVAEIIVNAVQYNADSLSHYLLLASVIVPNRVQLLITPAVPLQRVTKSLKSNTAQRANILLSLRASHSGRRKATTIPSVMYASLNIRVCIENNPVRADW